MGDISRTFFFASILALLVCTCTSTSDDEDCPFGTSLLQTDRTAQVSNVLQASSCSTSQILLMGGYTTDDDHTEQIKLDQTYALETNDPDAKWESPASLKLQDTRMAHCALTHGTKIYLLGGWSSTTPEELDLARSLNIFDLVDETWSTGPSMSIKRGFASCAIVDDKIYVIGNDPFPGDASPDPDSENTVEILDLATMEWQAGPRVPEAGCKTSAATTHGQDIYVIGCGSPAEKVHVLNTASNTWREGPDMLEQREDGTARTVGGTIYWFGGYEDHHSADAMANNEGTTEAFALDVNAEQWTRLPSMPVSTARLSSVALGNEIYLISGSLKYLHALKDVTIFNTETNQYRQGPALPMNITGSAAVVAAQC